ncbi:hypothetical protein V5279_19205 [Bradyrhizobium sp. 26S5]|uniref:hypothetical protein n=1 Tax=Bradyrhizobium sp. 26S5 TaxID=3139729 RepID=UPI0030CF4C9B
MFVDITDKLLPSLGHKKLDQTVAEAKQGMAPLRHSKAWHMFAKLAAHHTHNQAMARQIVAAAQGGANQKCSTKLGIAHEASEQ